MKRHMKKQIRRIAENLPEELELTESEWYEYDFYLRTNLFLVGKILDFPHKAKSIYVMESSQTYIDSILRAIGLKVHCDRPRVLQEPEIKGRPNLDGVVIDDPWPAGAEDEARTSRRINHDLLGPSVRVTLVDQVALPILDLAANLLAVGRLPGIVNRPPARWAGRW